VFGAIPLYTFHVYNGGLVKAGTAEGFDAQISASNFEPFIPDNSALITPEPGDWLGMMEGSEYVRGKRNGQSDERALRDGFLGNPSYRPLGC
jgi:hypothetical protein